MIGTIEQIYPGVIHSILRAAHEPESIKTGACNGCLGACSLYRHFSVQHSVVRVDSRVNDDESCRTPMYPVDSEQNISEHFSTRQN